MRAKLYSFKCLRIQKNVGPERCKGVKKNVAKQRISLHKDYKDCLAEKNKREQWASWRG